MLNILAYLWLDKESVINLNIFQMLFQFSCNREIVVKFRHTDPSRKSYNVVHFDIGTASMTVQKVDNLSSKQAFQFQTSEGFLNGAL